MRSLVIATTALLVAVSLVSCTNTKETQVLPAPSHPTMTPTLPCPGHVHWIKCKGHSGRACFVCK